MLAIVNFARTFAFRGGRSLTPLDYSLIIGSDTRWSEDLPPKTDYHVKGENVQQITLNVGGPCRNGLARRNFLANFMLKCSPLGKSNTEGTLLVRLTPVSANICLFVTGLNPLRGEG